MLSPNIDAKLDISCVLVKLPLKLAFATKLTVFPDIIHCENILDICFENHFLLMTQQWPYEDISISCFKLVEHCWNTVD